MTITIELPDKLAGRLAEASIHTADATRYVVTALDEAADSAEAEIRAWWEALPESARDRLRTKTEVSVTAADGGHSSAAEDVYAHVRAGRVGTLET